MPQKGVYPVTGSLVNWLSHTFEAIDEGAYMHFRGIRRITKNVDKGQQGSIIHRLQARSHLREYNDRNETDIQYEEVVHRNRNFIPAFEGDWVVFTDNSKAILEDEDADRNLMIEDALYCAPLSVRWALLWDPMEGIVIVYRSPVLGKKRELNPEFLMTCGLSAGEAPTFVLPPEIEAVIKQDMDVHINPEEVAESFSNCLSDRPVDGSILITEYLPWLTRS
jgi:hypothetical protein